MKVRFCINHPTKKHLAKDLCANCYYLSKKEVWRETSKRYYENNKEKKQEQARENYLAKKEHRISSHKLWRLANKEKDKLNSKNHYLKNKEIIKAKDLKRKYGLSKEEYYLLKEKQDNMCAICKISNRRLAVDHCHITGKIRGLLCLNCNTGIGQLKDSVELLESAINYLKING